MTLQPEEFEGLLGALHPERSKAGDEYEKLRLRLVTFFRWEGCVAEEDWADEVINRVARRIGRGDRIESLTAFVSGVARLVAKEAGRKQSREAPGLVEMPAPESAPKAPEAEKCLDQCLGALDVGGRSLILKYYDGDASARIRTRQAMAAELGISLNSLRNRALRLRDRLELCVGRCLDRDISRSADTKS
jgi:DNA-directed RNA polymerase specialized sigma24 family protein